MPRARLYPVAIHCTWSVLAPKSAWIREVATLTMLVSSSAMKEPIITTRSGTSHPPAAGDTTVRRAGALAGAGAARRGPGTGRWTVVRGCTARRGGRAGRRGLPRGIEGDVGSSSGVGEPGTGSSVVPAYLSPALRLVLIAPSPAVRRPVGGSLPRTVALYNYILSTNHSNRKGQGSARCGAAGGRSGCAGSRRSPRGSAGCGRGGRAAPRSSPSRARRRRG